MTIETVKRCETLNCWEPGERMVQIAPGTNVWLCPACRYLALKALK